MTRFLRLLRIVVILELAFALEIDRAGFTDRKLVALFVADMRDGVERLAHGTLVRQPFFGVERGETVALRAGIIFVYHRAPPLDHLFLHGNGAGGGGMDRDLERGHVIFGAHLLRHLEHAYEHGGHPLAVRDLVLLDEAQGFFRVEMLHDDHGSAEALHRHRPAQRRGVIKRRGGQVDRIRIHAVEEHCEAFERRVFADRAAGQRVLHALGAPCRSGRIEHVGTGRFVGNRRGRKLRAGFLEILIAGNGAFDGKLPLDTRGHVPVLQQLFCNLREGCRGKEQTRVTVVDDIGDFARGKP